MRLLHGHLAPAAPPAPARARRRRGAATSRAPPVPPRRFTAAAAAAAPPGADPRLMPREEPQLLPGEEPHRSMDPGQLRRVLNFLGRDGPPKQPRPALRIGVATYACIWPARRLPDVVIAGVAARDPKRAEAYARAHGIPRTYPSYAALVDDPGLDAVYIGLPNGLHGQWAAAALAAGKHVLCEKPFAANEEEARRVMDIAAARGRVCREAFHNAEHPAVKHAAALLQGGAIGELTSLRARVAIPSWAFGGGDIRFNADLAGGCMMDAGCYCAHALRFFPGLEPSAVLAASPKGAPVNGCDAGMVASVAYGPDPAAAAAGGGGAGPSPRLVGHLDADLRSDALLPVTTLTAEGTRGRLTMDNFLVPFFFHRITVSASPGDDGPAATRSVCVHGAGESNYWLQLRRFADDVAALEGRGSGGRTPAEAAAAVREDARGAVANAALVDAVYRAAGLRPREPTERWCGNDDGAPHVPVLLNEVLQQFSGRQVKVYVDCTLGAGGHAAHMLRQHPEMTSLVGFDLDPLAHQLAGARLERERAAAGGRPGLAVSLLRGNYSGVAAALEGLPGGSLAGRVDAMLMDLGVSSMQLDTPSRGFSFAADGPLDMRLNPDGPLSAADLVNGWSEEAIGRVLREYGEEKAWRAVARRIVDAREAAPITTTAALVAAVGQTVFRDKRGGGRGGRQIHPATRTFQALRIAVNDELRQLETALPAALACLAPGGRLAVISFHSLEDRLVKRALARAAGRPTPEDEADTHGPDGAAALDALRAAAIGEAVLRRPLTAGEEEVAANPRARSAKLRVFERAGGAGGGDGGSAGTVWRGSKRRRREAELQRLQQQGQQAPGGSAQ
ncbi:16S rRNA (cytosine(1402)-N(4))-methyltransferase [Raphidocelis subcapitata]|uniref:16S rRNA (Cytosine(1402)-N(4))-methyltransferase n=1 Tax=Raphidocelis subcapitata TaxID=307507 RepID=A0A2V0PJS2_9CHLO|nr:16S rRNA (cytosine(1402)-N(4))-methyltransferase [Raphidocelis subcapitata]|eukprot:GBF99789.1 16S rRNA (cytosine(1402)-N(4))-methyltransferase [Raphidocelis subcapitata]